MPSLRARPTQLFAFAGLAAALLGAGPSEPLRVGTSADYRPFSHAPSPGAEPEGFDLALLRLWAAERGRELEIVRFRWPRLLADLVAERFDLAASGVTVRPERSVAGRFGVPVAETAAWALARTPERWNGLASLDRPAIRIAVNAGGHLERVAARRFPNATRIAVPDNAAVLRLLVDEKVHAVVTDDAEAPHWEQQAGVPLARLGPLSRDRKAWLVRPDRPELARDLDAWLLAREADGTLARVRREWLGDESRPTADPLGALLAAVDERLALMPWVGVVKRRSGAALAAPAREERVLEHAVAAVAGAAERAGRDAPPVPAVRALFRAQIEAAKNVQRRALRDRDYEPADLPDLRDELRPALLRIGERIAALVVALPADLDATKLREAARDALRAPYLDDADRDAIADAIAALRPAA